MTHIVIISLFVFAIHYCFQEGEVFGFTQRIRLGWFADPLRDCPVCMIAWWGSLIYGLAWHGGWAGWILCVGPALGLNAVLVKLFPDKETPSLHGELENIADKIHEQTEIIHATGKPVIHTPNRKPTRP